MEKVEIILPIKINSKLSLNKLYGCNCHWSIRERKAREIHKILKSVSTFFGIQGLT